MITKQTHSTVFVIDQDRAKAFYTEQLGYEVRDDARMGDFRWLTVAPKTQPDHCLVLMALKPNPWMDAETVAQIRALVEKGALGGGVVACDDIQRTYEEMKARGVTFISPPQQMPYGMEAVFRDDSGNFFSLGERK